MEDTNPVEWKLSEVTSPHLAEPVSVIAAKDIPYVPNANRFQNLSIYLPMNLENSGLIGTKATSLPAMGQPSGIPRWYVHIHGGAWRDPNLTSASIESAAAHALSDSEGPIIGIVSINYTLTQFPTHPDLPYDAVKGNHSDPSREAVHPMHVRDVLHGFVLLRSLGLAEGSYVLSGHSCGACISSQAVLQPPSYWGIALPEPPRPAAWMGLNGLYDLPDLVHGLGASHQHLSAVYEDLLGLAFGTDQSTWPAASPTRFDTDQLSERVRGGRAPTLVLLDQSAEDQLVPLNQTERLEAHLTKVAGMRVLRGHRCIGRHAAPWEEGMMIWETLQDVLKVLNE